MVDYLFTQSTNISELRERSSFLSPSSELYIDILPMVKKILTPINNNGLSKGIFNGFILI